MIRVGIIGFGLSGRCFHAPFIGPAGMNLRAISTSRADEVAAVYPDVTAEKNPEALISRSDIDLVIIASPNDSHAPLALAALAAGKHVVIDKPIAVSVAEAEALLAEAQRRRRTLAVFHNRRWDADFLTLRDVIAAGELGDIVTFDSRIDRYRPDVPDRWRDRSGPGAGLLYDLAPHLLDQALVLFGWPEWIEAEIMKQRPGAQTADAFFIRLGKGRLRMQLSASALVADNAARFTVHGDKGSFIKTGVDVQEGKLKAGRSPLETDFGREPETQYPRITTIKEGSLVLRTVPTQAGRYLAFYEELRNSIETSSPPPVTAEDGRRVMRLIALALESGQSQKRISCNDS